LLKGKIKNIENTGSPQNFISYFETFIQESKIHKAPSTIIKYGNTLNHLKTFSSKYNFSLEFEGIDRKFYNLFYEYLVKDAKLTNNTIAKVVKTLKVFMSYAVDQKKTSKLDYLGFKSTEVEGEIIFLTWDELMRLYNLKISLKFYEKVRDVFCFQCFTGLRYSDIQNLRKDSVVGDFLHINVIKKKEKKTISIPLVTYAKEILSKYSDLDKDRLLPPISSQKMNEDLKKIAGLAKIDEPVIVMHYRGSERIENVLPKHKLITTHIGRKTFITNALDREVPAEVVMSISDHSTHKAFKRYYKVLEERKKRELFKAFEK
jgi:integrase